MKKKLPVSHMITSLLEVVWPDVSLPIAFLLMAPNVSCCSRLDGRTGMIFTFASLREFCDYSKVFMIGNTKRGEKRPAMDEIYFFNAAR